MQAFHINLSYTHPLHITKKNKSKFVSVSIPRQLIEKIDLVIESGKQGYESRPEFIKDALRRRFQELGFE